MLGVFRVLYIVAGISSFVNVSRSASVPFLISLLSLVSSFSVLPRSLFMPDRAFVLPLAVSQPHVFHRQVTESCLSRGSRMQRHAVTWIEI